MPDPQPPAPPAAAVTLLSVTLALLAGAAGWFLLDRLAVILRPFLVAVFLAYVLLPYHTRLRRWMPAAASLGLLAGVTAGVVAALGFAVSVSLLELRDDLPRLQTRAVALFAQAQDWVRGQAPWLAPAVAPPGDALAEKLGAAAVRALNTTADVFIEAVVIGLYLMFLLLEAGRAPDRVRAAYPPEKAAEILHVAGHVNAAVVGHLRAKVRASLAIAVPVGLILWGFGVRFPLLWAILTFLCNFIPYIGSAVAFTLPVGFGFLQYGADWRPVVAAGLLAACHGLCAAVVEPLIIGKAVGLSPLVILGSLAFWGLLWGLPGMFLAVPLTVVAVIVMGEFEFTRPVARLLGGG